MKSLLADFRLAMRNLMRNRWRTSVAVLTVAFGIVAFLLAGGFITWIFQQMREGGHPFATGTYPDRAARLF